MPAKNASGRRVSSSANLVAGREPSGWLRTIGAL
jgi:hypothetical protein